MGLYPAWQSSRADLVDGLKEGGRAMSGSRGQHRFRRGLVAAQVGFSVVLLAGRGNVGLQFRPAEPTGSRVSVGSRLGRRHRTASGAISRSRVA